ncbi:hypothetical protein [Microbacterium sp. GXF7504]
MTQPPLGSSVRLVASITGVLALAAVTVGCSASSTEAASTPAPTVTVTVTEPNPEVTDAESCEQFADVVTVVSNVRVDAMDGRMSEQEARGWNSLATRMLDRIPTRGEGAVSDEIAALKELSPAVPSGAKGDTIIGTDEWFGSGDLANACEEAGAPYSILMFTGG